MFRLLKSYYLLYHLTLVHGLSLSRMQSVEGVYNHVHLHTCHSCAVIPFYMYTVSYIMGCQKSAVEEVCTHHSCVHVNFQQRHVDYFLCLVSVNN